MNPSQYDKFPSYHLAVDCVIFGYENRKLKLLLSRRDMEPEKNKWSLQGGWLNPDETVEQAAERVLFNLTGLKDIYLEQVYVFSNPERDPGGRVVSIVFFALIRIDKYDKELVSKHGAKWRSLRKKPDLIFDHDKMVEHAHERLKLKASYEIIGKKLLPSKFTLLQLRNLYEAIFERVFDPGNFRKKILSLKVLERLDVKNTTDSKRGAYYYRFKEGENLAFNDRFVKLNS